MAAKKEDLVLISIKVDRADWDTLKRAYPGSASFLVRQLIRRFVSNPNATPLDTELFDGE